MSRALLAALLTSVFVLASGDLAGAPPAPRPNFIVFIADDVSWDDIGAYGNRAIHTPNIDALAQAGMRFDQAILTGASCSPVRCSLLTGRYPHSTGASEAHQPLPADQVTFVEVLKRAGYHTASTGKWHLGDPAAARFDKVRRAIGGTSGSEHWLETMRARPPGKPFFLWLASLDAHRPYERHTIPQPYLLEDVIVPPFLPSLREIRLELAQYYEEITRLDDYIGEILAELTRQGEAERTFVIFLSDGGRPFPRCKATLHDSGIKSPWIVRFPRMVKPGTTCRELISAVDLAPTILELAGLQTPGTVQGLSFARLLKGEPAAEVRKYAYAEQNWHDYSARKRAVRTTTYTYIRNFYPDLPDTPPADVIRTISYQAMLRAPRAERPAGAVVDSFLKPGPAEELYDLARDPHELHNVAADPRHAAMLQELRDALARWQRETDDREPARRRPDEYDRRTGERLPGAPRPSGLRVPAFD